MSRLHVFDMDGTLLRQTSASIEIARRLGCLADLAELEKSFEAGTLDTRGFAANLYLLWQSLTPTLVHEVFTSAPWIDGLPEVLSDIRRRGERSIVVTMSPDFFADRLTTFGVDEVVASRFPELPLRTEPNPADILTPADKVSIVERTLADLGLERDMCIAYGDSGSDIPLFRALRYTVAVNANDRLRKLALLQYEGDDLRIPYRLIRNHFENDRGTWAGSAGMSPGERV